MRLYRRRLLEAKVKKNKLKIVDPEGNVHIFGPGREVEGFDSGFFDGNVLDLPGFDMSNMTIYHSNLSGLNLEGGSLSGATLFRVELSGCNLDNADLTDIEGEYIDLSYSSLRGANLDGLTVEHLIFYDTDLTGARMAHFDIRGDGGEGPSFDGAIMNKMDFTGSQSLQSIYFDQVPMVGARFDNAWLDETRFLKCDLRKASFVNVDWDGGIETKLYKCDLRGARFDDDLIVPGKKGPEYDAMLKEIAETYDIEVVP